MMKIFDKNFKEIFFFEILSVIGGLIAGTFLAIYTDKLILIPGMFIVLPGLMALRGNISGSFSSRVSSGLFLKVIKPYELKTKIIKGNLAASFALVLIVSLVLGLAAFFATYIIFNEVAFKIILLPVVAGAIANIFEIPLALFLTYYLFRKGHDPNNIMGPLITSTGDITTILALIISLVII